MTKTPSGLTTTVSDYLRKTVTWIRRLPFLIRALILLSAVFLVTTLIVNVAVVVANQLYPVNMDRYADRSSVVLAADNSLLDIGFTRDFQRRMPVTVDEVSNDYLRALIAYEDKRFYRHSGVDYLALIRSMGQMVRHRRVISGASTLTMQAVKLLEPRPRTLSTKIIEIFRAWQLEADYTKDEILSFYMTLAPMGGNIEGVKTASLLYFNRDPSALTMAETALLVALPQNPSRLAPRRFPQQAKAARNKVAKRIQKAFGATDTDLMAVAQSPVIYYQQDSKKARLFSQRVAIKGQTIQTTIQPDLQQDIEILLKRHLSAIAVDATIAAMVVDARTSTVLAYVGNAAYGNERRAGFIDMLTVDRSPGSTLKPFIYGAAMDENLINLKTRIRDEATNFGHYSPTNFNKRFYGQTTIEHALKHSLNIPAVKVLERLGPKTFALKLSQAGVRLRFPGNKPASLPLALGGTGISAEDLMKLYTALASDGKVRSLTYTMHTSAANEDAKPLLSESSRQAIHKTLLGTRSPYAHVSPVFTVNSDPIAFKTGTSYGYRDAWAMGNKGRYIIGVWVGKADATPHTGHYGIKTAAPILMNIAALLPSDKAPSTALAAKPDNTPAASKARSIPRHQIDFDQLPRQMYAAAYSNGYSNGYRYQAQPPQIIYPYTNSILAFQPNQSTAIQVQHGKRPFHWYINGKKMAVSPLKRDIKWTAPSPGFYDIVVIDALGEKSTVSIRMKALNQSSHTP